MQEDTDRQAAIRRFLGRPEIGRAHVPAASLAWYDAALTHRSYAHEQGDSGQYPDNERLEFLGDRVLNLVVAEILFRGSGDPEGILSARMEFARNQNLAAMIATAGIGFTDMIRVGCRQEKTPGIIAGALEAFIAALYLDAGLESAKNMVYSLFSDDILNYSTEKNYKKELQEYLQKREMPLPVYELVERDGDDHAPVFSYVVAVGDIPLGRGRGKNKGEATQEAARAALKQVKKSGGPP
ncbi:MAG TPA: ribonuclease III [Methanoregulaceae archaeon]|nr:ribonuclease III [Methanoregulaceae archaeon]